MKAKDKIILNKIKEINDQNKKYFDKKAKLEEEILICDIKIHGLMQEYNKLISKLFYKE